MDVSGLYPSTDLSERFPKTQDCTSQTALYRVRTENFSLNSLAREKKHTVDGLCLPFSSRRWEQSSELKTPGLSPGEALNR